MKKQKRIGAACSVKRAVGAILLYALLVIIFVVYSFGISSAVTYGMDRMQGQEELPNQPLSQGSGSEPAEEKTRYISGYVYLLDDKWVQGKDGDLMMTAWAESEFDPYELPDSLEAVVSWKVDDGYAGVDFVEWEVNWHTEELEGQSLTAGAITIHGRWGEPCGEDRLEDGTVATEVTDVTKSAYEGVYEPVLTLVVVEPKGIELPEQIRFYDPVQPEGVRIERESGRLIRIQTKQNYPLYTVHKIFVRQWEQEEWELIYMGGTGSIGGGRFHLATVDDALSEGVGIQLKNFKESDWFQDGLKYEVMVETSRQGPMWDIAMNSNIMTVDMTEVEGGGDGGSSGSDDGSSGGNRGGGSRDTQDTDTKKTLNASQLATLAKANPAGTALVLDGVKVIFTADRIADWAKADVQVLAEGKRTGDSEFELSIKVNGKPVSHVNSVVTIRVPMADKSAVLRGLSSRDAETQLVAKRNGVSFPAAYYDGKSGEMVIKTNGPGAFKIERAAERKFADTEASWAEAGIAFASARGLVNGYGDNTYRGQQPVTAEELRTILGKTVKGSLGSASGKMPLAGGVEDRLSQPINRVTAAKWISEYCGDNLNQSKPVTAFQDLSGLSASDREAVEAVQRFGIMSGRRAGIFAPYSAVTRAEAAVIMENLIKAD